MLEGIVVQAARPGQILLLISAGIRHSRRQVGTHPSWAQWPHRGSPLNSRNAAHYDLWTLFAWNGNLRAVRSTRRALGVRRFDLHKALFVLPNLVTLASVFCGMSAIRLVSEPRTGLEPIYRACILLVFAMFFDLLDGRVARMTKTQSAFGLQLDSLADVISFGVAPALIVYQWALFRAPALGQLTSFAYVAAGAVRLARFNVISSMPSGQPTKPGRHILGLPIPCAAAGLVSLIMADHAVGGALSQPRYTGFIFAATILLSLFMVSTIRFRSFKDLRFDTRSMLFVFFTCGTSALVWRNLEPEFVLVWLLLMYVAIGFLESTRLIAARLRRIGDRKSLPPSL